MTPIYEWIYMDIQPEKIYIYTFIFKKNIKFLVFNCCDFFNDYFNSFYVKHFELSLFIYSDTFMSEIGYSTRKKYIYIKYLYLFT